MEMGSMFSKRMKINGDVERPASPTPPTTPILPDLNEQKINKQETRKGDNKEKKTFDECKVQFLLSFSE
jgi:hypothetical protein